MSSNLHEEEVEFEGGAVETSVDSRDGQVFFRLYRRGGAAWLSPSEARSLGVMLIRQAERGEAIAR